MYKFTIVALELSGHGEIVTADLLTVFQSY